MLKIIEAVSEVDFQQLCDIYEEYFSQNLTDRHREVSAFAVLQERQEFYSFLLDFFNEDGSIYAVWMDDGRYCSALRLEKYLDGYLLTGLEAATNMRRKGHASNLIKSIIEYCEANASLPIYSHISNNNIPSIKVHKNNSFCVIKDFAVYLDGSVDHRSKTYCYKKDEV